MQLSCRYHNSNSKEIREVVLDYIRNEKRAHLGISRGQPAFQNGHPLREGRPDRLIDVCLFFIPPHRFTDRDEDFIVEVSKEVSVIPICAKADAMTSAERTAFQHVIRERLAHSTPCSLANHLSYAVYLHC